MQRKPIAGLHFSVERYFAALRAELPDDITARLHTVPFFSKGVARRLADTADVARQRADVVHVTGDIHFAALGARAKRSVLTVLDCGSASGDGIAAAVYRRLWVQWPARHVARVVAISAPTADEIAALAGIPRERIDVVPISVGEEYTPRPASAHDGPPVVLCFARTANKNFTRVIEAVRGLDVHLNVIGLQPNDEVALRATGLAFTSGSGLDDATMRARYAACDAVLFPSTYEGFGMPIIEAQAVGRPVVTSARAPMDDVAGDGACLVDPDDPASIRAGLERVLSDARYRADLVRRGQANRERFRPAEAARAYAQIYREVAG